MSRLLHHAAAPRLFDHTRTYSQESPRGYGKPVGFWVSVAGPDDWATWCEKEEFLQGNFAHTYEITLAASANVLHIGSGDELDAFHQIYSVETDSDRRWAGYAYIRRQWPMDWNRVTKEYDGIIIAPYIWSHRLTGPAWYYGFDCASGCIWNLTAIESVEETS